MICWQLFALYPLLDSNIKGVGMTCSVSWILFDFGGVLSEEGFRGGLGALAREQGLDPATVQRAGVACVFETGYVTGHADGETFWRTLKDRTGLRGSEPVLRRVVLDHFRLRPWMLELVRQIRKGGTRCAILSDQVDWLDTLNERDAFFPLFDRIYNSYHLGQSKQDPQIFARVTADLGISPGEALFVDDSPDNVRRAESQGLSGIVHAEKQPFLEQIRAYCPDLDIDRLEAMV